MDRLAALRGTTPPKPHDARAIAALAANPGCARRALMDGAGIDKSSTARHLGFAPPFGQSPFAIARGNVFEAQVRTSLAELLGSVLGLADVTYLDLRGAPLAVSDDSPTLHDRPGLTLPIAGQSTPLEPSVPVLSYGGRCHVVVVKSFAVIDGQADPAAVAAAARQGAVYALALQASGLRVADDMVLVCPENFANRPVATLVDVRRQLAVLRRQLGRMTSLDSLAATLPAEVTFDLRPDDSGEPTRPAADLATALGHAPARYAPECLSTCDLCYFCRDEARQAGASDQLGRHVRDALGGVATVGEALALADGTRDPEPGQEEIARLLREASRLRAECLT
ncbi:hypothetical protein ACIBHX_15090 [Nonomuraea sp. NPDC050536]|uniref:hypothetical protein n=1 Tax=Nonomuraea sp. NPDC050536 TaxID=3364366 RepID=UPI0037CA61C0